MSGGIEPKDILNWYFTVGSTAFGVFGFVYTLYATAMFQVTPNRAMPPGITVYLRGFCRFVVAVLALMTLMAVVTAAQAAVGWAGWAMIGCFAALTACSIVLAVRMA